MILIFSPSISTFTSFDTWYGLNIFVPHPQHYSVKALIPNVMVLEVGPLEIIKSEGGAIMHMIRAF